MTRREDEIKGLNMAHAFLLTSNPQALLNPLYKLKKSIAMQRAELIAKLHATLLSAQQSGLLEEVIKIQQEITIITNKYLLPNKDKLFSLLQSFTNPGKTFHGFETEFHFIIAEHLITLPAQPDGSEAFEGTLWCLEQLLINNKKLATYADEYNRTLLMCAAIQKSCRLIELLIQYGATPNNQIAHRQYPYIEGETAALMAINHLHQATAVAKLLSPELILTTKAQLLAQRPRPAIFEVINNPPLALTRKKEIFIQARIFQPYYTQLREYHKYCRVLAIIKPVANADKKLKFVADALDANTSNKKKIKDYLFII